MSISASQLVATIGADISPLLMGVAQAKASLRDFGASSAVTASSVSQSWGRDMSAAGRSAVTFGKTVASAAATAAMGMAALALGSAKMAGDFDQNMRNVDSIAKLTGSQFNDLSQSVLKMVHDPNIKQSADDLAKGLYDIYSSGATGQQALDDLHAAAIGASAGMTDTATATRVLMGVLNSGIGGVTSAQQAMDVLFQEVNLGVNTFEELAQQIGPLLPLSARAGISLQEISAAMAVLTVNGTDAAESATQLQGFISHLIGATGQAAKEMDYLGIAHGLTAVKAEGLMGALKNVTSATKHHQDALHDLFPEIRSFVGLLSLTGDGGAKYTSFLNQMSHASDGLGAATEANNRQMAGVKAQYEKLASEIQADLIPAGLKLLPVLKSFEPVLKDAAGAVIGVLQAFSHLPQSVQEAILLFGAAKLAAGTMGIGFGSVAGGALKMVGGFNGIKIAGAAVLDLFGVMATEGTALAAGLGLAGLAVAAFAGTFLLVKADVEMALDAMRTFDDAKARSAAADAGRAALNNTGDNKRNMIGEASKIAYEQGNIKAAMDKVRANIANSLSRVGDDDDSAMNHALLAKNQAALTALQASYNAQDANRKKLLTAAKEIAYTSHSAAYGQGASPAAAKAPTSDNSGGSVKAEMAAQSAAAKDAKQQQKEQVSAALDLLKVFTSQSTELSKQTFLLGKSSQVAQVQADIRYGDLGKLSAKEQGILLTLAAQYDARKKQQDVVDALNKSSDDLFVSGLSKQMQAIVQAAGGYREWLKIVHQGTDAQNEFVGSFLKMARNAETTKFGDTLRGLGDDMTSLSFAGRGVARNLGVEAAGGIEEYRKAANMAYSATETFAQALTRAASQKAWDEGAVSKMKDLQEQVWDTSSAFHTASDSLSHFFATLAHDTGASLTPAMQTLKTLTESAAKSLDMSAANRQILTWQTDLSGQIETAKAKIAGTYDPARAAVAAWAAQNKDALDKLKAEGGDASGVLANVALVNSLNAQADAAEKMRQSFHEAGAELAALTAQNPFEAWKASLGPMPGVDPKQFKDMYDLQQRVELIKDAASGMRDTITNAFHAAFEHGAKSFFGSVVQGFNQMLRDMAVQQLTSRVTQGLTGLLGGLLGGGVKGGASTPGIKPVGAFASAAGNSFGGFSFSPVTFGGARASGGPVAVGLPYLVGERGPEIVVPRASGNVIPNHHLAMTGGAGEGGDTHHNTVNITVQSSGGNREMDRRTAQQVAEATFHQMLRAYQKSGNY